MKTIQMITVLFCLIMTRQNIEAQNQNSEGNGTTVIVWPHHPLLFLGAGSANPGSALKTDAHFNNFTTINLEGYIPLIIKNKSSFGLNTGIEYSFENSSDFGPLPSPYQVSGQSSLPIITTKGGGSPKVQGFTFEAGPSAMIKIGNGNFGINPSINAAYINSKQKSFNAVQTSVVNGVTYNWELLRQNEIKTSGLGIIPKVRLLYMFGRIGVWIEGSYRVGPKVNIVSVLYHPEGNVHQDGTYDVGQMNFPSYTTSEISRRYQAFTISGGVVIPLGGGKDPNNMRRLKGKVIRMGDKGIVRGRFSDFIKVSESGGSTLNPNTGLIPQRAHLRVFCIDGKKVMKYYDYKGNLYDILYTKESCNSKTWPINGVEGDMSTDFDDRTKIPVKWNGTLTGMFEIKNPDLFVNAASGIEELMKTINKTKTYQTEILTDAIRQKYISVVYKDNNELIREILPIDESGPMDHVKNVDIRCVGSCNGGNSQPCIMVAIPGGGLKCQDCGNFSTNTTCRSVTGWSNPSGWHHNLKVIDIPGIDENSSVTSPSVSNLIKKILPEDYTPKTVEVNKIAGQKYLSILASNGIKSVILINKLEGKVSNNNWFAYFSEALPSLGKDLPNMIQNTHLKTIADQKKEAVGQIVLLEK